MKTQQRNKQFFWRLKTLRIMATNQGLWSCGHWDWLGTVNDL
jgi:hypothetical protein